jgi:hypothetical protein
MRVRPRESTEQRSLALGKTQVTDAGLVHLKGLTELSSLRLRGTQLKSALVKEHQEALPKLEIIR